MEKINQVVFIIKENRTFDNYFGTFSGADGATSGTISTGDVIPLGHTPDRTPRDISHSWNSALTAIDGGAMDQFNLIPGGNQNGDYLSYTQLTERHPELLRPGEVFHSGRRDVFLVNRTELSESPLHCRRTVRRCDQ
jgi:phospholipase C